MRIWKIVGSLALVLIGVGIVWGQSEEDLPPQVIGVQPFAGEEMRVDSPLRMVFNQSMNQEATQAAFSLQPELAGDLTWEDGRTLVFTPTETWERGGKYDVTISTAAQAENGLTMLEEYRFTARIVGNLEVASIIPEDGVEGVAADATITVAFNRPVVPLVSTENLDELPDPLAIEPAITGKGEWLNTSIYQFTPSEPLLGGATYTVTVKAGLEDFTGASLLEDYVFSFKTLVPEILSTNPYEGSSYLMLESDLSVTFSQPMDQASVEESFRVLDPNGEPVAGDFAWTDTGTSFTFSPKERLRIESLYQFVLEGSTAKGLGGASLREGRNFFFSTVPLPYIQSTYPTNRDVDIYPGLQNVAIYFATPMNTDTFEGKYLISPQPAEVTPLAGSQNLSLQFEFMAETEYTITVFAGTEDVYGNAIQSNYSFAFRTGQIRPYAYLQDTNRLVVTGSYREDTVLPIQLAGQPSVDFELYNLPVEDVQDFVWYTYDDLVTARFRDRNRLLRRWTQVFDNGSGDRISNFNLLSDEGGALPLGMYYLYGTYTSPDDTSNPRKMPVAVAVANSTVSYKRFQNQVLVWVTDMQTGEPLPNQTIRIYSYTDLIATGTTDDEGILHLNELGTYDFITVTSESAGYFGIWYNTYGPGTPSTDDLYIYTDRPIYRPDETVHFKGVYRSRDDVDFSAAGSVETVDITIDVNYGQQILLEDTFVLNEFGTFSGEVVLPPDVTIGQLRIYGRNVTGEVSAQIAEFRVPEYSVTVTPSQDEILSSDPLNVLVNSTYFSGGSVSDAYTTWYASASQTTFNYTGEGRYSFTDSPYYGYYFYDDFGYYGGYGGRTIANGEGQTDSSGNLLIELDETATQLSSTNPEMVTVEATITDESGQYISGRGTFIIHPSEVYVGVRTNRYFGRENEPLDVDIVTVNPQSETIPEQNVTLKLIERRWERIAIEGQFGRYNWEQTEIEVESVQLTSDETGRATHQFTPPNAGIFVIRAETRDLRERLHVSSTQIWVAGRTPVWWGEPTNTIEMIADKDSYEIGDTAEILIPVSLEGKSWLMITRERVGVMSYEIIPVEGSTYVYQVPIDEDSAPMIHLGVVVIHGIDEGNPVPTYRLGTLALNVEPKNKLLNISVTPSDENAQPQQTVDLEVTATNPDGSPAQAEISLAMVDSAILTLAAPNSQSPRDHYYSTQSNYTVTETMLKMLIDGRVDQVDKAEDERLEEEARRDVGQLESDMAFADGMVAQEVASAAPAPTMTASGEVAALGGGGPDFQSVTVRQDFQQTPLWEPHLVTDSDGRATVSVTLPDNLTIWDISARAVTTDTLVGETEAEIQSTLPLLVRPSVPRFFVVGDEVVLAMVVNNNSSETQTIQTTMQGTGFELMDGETLEKAVEVEADGRVRVEWNVKILDVRGVDLTFIALGEDGYQDAAKPSLTSNPDGTIPVYRYTAPDTVGTAGVLREDGVVTEGISIPPFADTDQGTLTLQLDPSLAVTTIDALDYLQNYEHQCIEQTVSRFLPNVVTYRALKSLGVDDPELEANLREALDFGVTRLRDSQNLDGGWGWFERMESSSLVTAYALLGLLEARNAGYDISENMIDRAIPIVLADLIQPTEDTTPWKLNRQAFYFYVLTRDAKYSPSQNQLDALFAVRLEMSDYAQALLLMSYHAAYPQSSDQIASIRSDLITRAKLSATGAHWEETFTDWWNWNNDIRSTAMVLSALIQTDPTDALLPNAVRWLMVARRGTHWESTQDTTWAVMALTDWMVATNELQGDYSYQVALNGAELGNGVVTPDTVRDGQTLVVEVKDLLLDEINRVSVIRGEGDGALYYTAHLRLRLDASQVEAIDRGISVTREYFVDGESVTEAQQGDIITVRLTINVPETIYYFVMEDPIPAGTEPLDTSLLTTTRAIEGPQLIPQYDPYYWWWWWIWDHTEVRDEKVNLYADELYPGTYVYSYQIQATNLGKFQTIPSHAYAFYFPEVFGRSDGTLFTITPAERE